MLFTLRMLTINHLSQRLVHRQRQDILIDFRTILYLFTEKRILLEKLGFTQRVSRDIVQSQRQFLIYMIVIMLLLFQVIQFFAGHHLLHQFNSRIVLTGIFLTFRFHYHFVQSIFRRIKFYDQFICPIVNGDFLGIISHRGESQFLPFRELVYLETTIHIGDSTHSFTFIKHICIHNGFARLGILQNAIDLCQNLVETHPN